jgi:ketosteroid isomerase-like protein
MTDILKSNISEGQRRPFVAHGYAELGDAGAVSMLHGVFEPGWRWSEDIAPLAKTETCQVRHHGYVISGSMMVRMDDGAEIEVMAGDLFDLPPGHDAWVTSDVPCEMVDVSPDATKYATPGSTMESDDDAMKLVRRGYEAFNTGDAATLMNLFAKDAVQHVPGSGPFAGTYKGPEAILGYYGKLAEHTGGTFRAHLMDVHGDGSGHVMASHLISAERNGQTRVSRGSLVFTFVGDKATDLLELHGDLPGDDAFFA